MLIAPDTFEACFTVWAQFLAEAFEREVRRTKNGKRLLW
jgi:hypothetical protein